MVSLGDAINECYNSLKNSVQNARYEAELLAAHILKKDRIYLNIHKDDLVDKDFEIQLKKITELRKSGMPFAYISKKKEFMSLEFSVNDSVLIPRPETEEVVCAIIELCKNKKVKILDLCTGSGAIAISCAYYLPDATCVGVDISEKALEVARGNAKSIGVDLRTDFIKLDVLNPGYEFPDKFDILVSNPPYIETSEISKLDKTVKNFEPSIALDGGADGLDFYKKIILDVNKYLKKDGIIIFEIGYNQGDDIYNLMKDKFTNIKILKDFSGNDRIAQGTLI